MTTEQHVEILTELRAIRDLLSSGNATALKAASAKPASTGTNASKDIPLPDEVIENPEQVAVHFGKNAGVPLGSLGAKSIEWYAQEPEPRLKKDGTPFPPRPDDVLLRNAARTIVHRARGTLVDPKPVLQTEPVSDEVPF